MLSRMPLSRATGYPPPEISSRNPQQVTLALPAEPEIPAPYPIQERWYMPFQLQQCECQLQMTRPRFFRARWRDLCTRGGADTIASAYDESLGSGLPMHPILTYPMLGASKSIASVEQSVHGDIFICSGIQSRAATYNGQRGLEHFCMFLAHRDLARHIQFGTPFPRPSTIWVTKIQSVDAACLDASDSGRLSIYIAPLVQSVHGRIFICSGVWVRILHQPNVEAKGRWMGYQND
ncbi:hypothetical protein BDW68DRAFT_92851 [Aspergillus falconensis]